MKRSKKVSLTMVPIVAAAFTACGGGQDEWSDPKKAPTHQQVCVDKNKNVVDSSQCGGVAAGQSTSSGLMWMFVPYMMGRMMSPGMNVSNYGGSYTAPSGPGVRSSVYRGGFGSTGSGSRAGSSFGG